MCGSTWAWVFIYISEQFCFLTPWLLPLQIIISIFNCLTCSSPWSWGSTRSRMHPIFRRWKGLDLCSVLCVGFTVHGLVLSHDIDCLCGVPCTRIIRGFHIKWACAWRGFMVELVESRGDSCTLWRWKKLGAGTALGDTAQMILCGHPRISLRWHVWLHNSDIGVLSKRLKLGIAVLCSGPLLPATSKITLALGSVGGASANSVFSWSCPKFHKVNQSCCRPLQPLTACCSPSLSIAVLHKLLQPKGFCKSTAKVCNDVWLMTAEYWIFGLLHSCFEQSRHSDIYGTEKQVYKSITR